MPDPARDCPPCPSCGLEVGTPADPECGVERGRWYGPPDSTLFCPACGTGWVGTPEHVAQAWASWRCYEREQAGHDTCPKCCVCPHPKDQHGYDGCWAPKCGCRWDLHFHPRPATAQHHGGTQ